MQPIIVIATNLFSQISDKFIDVILTSSNLYFLYHLRKSSNDDKLISTLTRDSQTKDLIIESQRKDIERLTIQVNAWKIRASTMNNTTDLQNAI